MASLSSTSSGTLVYGDSSSRTKSRKINYRQKVIFGYGYTYATNSITSINSIISDSGYISADITGVGPARLSPAGSGYGGDKGIFTFGDESGSIPGTSKNLVSNIGVVATYESTVATARSAHAGASYGYDKAIFAYGINGSTAYTIVNLVSNVGVVASDSASSGGTARAWLGGASYGYDKAIFGFGYSTSAFTAYSVSNLFSNTGTYVSETSNATFGGSKWMVAAASYGDNRAIFGFGRQGSSRISVTNKVSNTGTIIDYVTTSAQAREFVSAGTYGEGKAVFGFGKTGLSSSTSVNTLSFISNEGAYVQDTSSVGSVRYGTGAANFG